MTVRTPSHAVTQLSPSWILVAPLIVAGFLVTAFTPRSHPQRRPRPLSIPQDGESLRRDLIGRTKTVVSRMLGVPRSAVVAQGLVAMAASHVTPAGTPASPLSADTWYYPLNAPGNWVMAIQFADDVASEVEIFAAP